MWARLGCAMIMSFVLLELMIVDRGFTWTGKSSLFWFMTEWSLWCTAFTYFFGLAMYLKPFAKTGRVKKAYVILFEVAFSFEIMVTLLFWVFLGHHKSFEKAPTARGKFSMALNHGIPMACLIVDYCFNRVPIYFGHWKLIAGIGVAYNVVLFTFMKTYGEARYYGETFDSFAGWIEPMIIFCLVPLMSFFALVKFNKWKLKEN